MTNRQVATLAVVAVALMGLTMFLYLGERAYIGSFVPGAPLIQGLDPADIHKIVIRSGTATVTLARSEEGFTVAEKYNYPASAKLINDLIIKCLDIRCKEKLTEDPRNHEQLGVLETDKDAVVISFLGEADKPIVGLVKGKNPEGAMGVCVRLVGQNPVYVSTEHLWFNTGPTDYLNKTIVKVEKADVEQIDVKIDEEAYTIRRDEKDQYVLSNVPEGKRAKKFNVEDVFGALSGLDFSDVQPAAQETLEWDATYTARLKSHLSYIVNLAKKGDEHYIRLRASFPPDIRVARPDKDTPQEELKKKEAILLASETAPKFTEEHAGWVYKVSSWEAGKLRKPFAELIEDDVPEEIFASHILIAYKGAEKADEKITRTKDEAQMLAKQVLAEAKTEGADFAELARKYSNCTSAEKGGDLGSFKKGKMAKAFDDAAFKLKVDEISAVVETEFGFHVIKRTR